MSLKKKVILTSAALGATLCLFSNEAIATVTVNPAKPTNVMPQRKRQKRWRILSRTIIRW